MKSILPMLGAMLVVSACSSTKFDFQAAYKFSQIKNVSHQEQVTQSQDITSFDINTELLTSIKPVYPAVHSLPSDQALKNFRNPNSGTVSLLDDYKNASKEERRAIRKQVRQEYKTLRKQVKEAKQDAVAKDIVFNKKMYIGAVILAAGILVAILASGGVGAVGIIVGIGLMAWGLIEQA